MTTKLFFLKTICVVLVNCSLLNAQEASVQTMLFDAQKVVPNSYAATTGTNQFEPPFASTQMTYQLLIAASQLTDLVGKNLVSISFRNTFNAATPWPQNEVTFINYDIYMSAGVNPANRTLFFAQNAIGAYTQVRSGNLVIPSNALTVGSNPNNFSFDIDFTTPYFYNGGNLLVEIRHFGFAGTARRVDSVNTAVAGYGTLFSACWYPSNTTSSNSAFEDSFSVVNFKAVNTLNTADFIENESIVFPNPSAENVQIESNSTILNIQLFTILGQLILVKEVHQQSMTLDLSSFMQGTYLLVIENEFGKVTKKVVKK